MKTKKLEMTAKDECPLIDLCRENWRIGDHGGTYTTCTRCSFNREIGKGTYKIPSYALLE